MSARDKTGKTRIRCSAVRESGSCSNHRILYLSAVEKAALTGMAEELKDPRLIETYVRTYNEERKRLAATAISTKAKIERKRYRLESDRQRAIDMAIKGVIGEEDARTRIAVLKTQVLQAEGELASLDETPQVIALHPATLTRYIETVDRLAAVLADHALAQDARGSLVPDSCALVHIVTIHPPRRGKAFRSK